MYKDPYAQEIVNDNSPKKTPEPKKEGDSDGNKDKHDPGIRV